MSEAGYAQYQRQRGALEEEQDRLLREGRKRLEYHEQLTYEHRQWLERLHYSFEYMASRCEGVEAVAGHRVIEAVAEEGQARLRGATEAAARQLEEDRRDYNKRLDALEQAYYR